MAIRVPVDNKSGKQVKWKTASRREGEAEAGVDPNLVLVQMDRREKHPLKFSEAILVVPAHLKTGDYRLAGGKGELLTVERKSIEDLALSCSQHRRRFEAEVRRMKGIQQKILLIEASLTDVLEGRYRCKVSPSSLLGTLTTWLLRYGLLPVFASDAKGAAAFAERLFLKAAESGVAYQHPVPAGVAGHAVLGSPAED